MRKCEHSKLTHRCFYNDGHGGLSEYLLCEKCQKKEFFSNPVRKEPLGETPQ